MLLTYDFSILETGSPSLTNDTNRFFRQRRSPCGGLVNGTSDTGGAPNETMWILLKHPVKMLSSDLTVSLSMWAYKRAATAPPALWPVMRREHEARLGFSSSNCRSLAATGLTIFRATSRKPPWHKFPASSRKPSGDVGAVCKFTTQSMILLLAVP